MWISSTIKGCHFQAPSLIIKSSACVPPRQENFLRSHSPDSSIAGFRWSNSENKFMTTVNKEEPNLSVCFSAWHNAIHVKFKTLWISKKSKLYSICAPVHNNNALFHPHTQTHLLFSNEVEKKIIIKNRLNTKQV